MIGLTKSTCLDRLALMCPVQMVRLIEYMMFMRFQIKINAQELNAYNIMHIQFAIFFCFLLALLIWKQL